MKLKTLIIIMSTIFVVGCGTNSPKDSELLDKYKLNVLDSLIIRLESSSVCCKDSLIFIAEKFGNNIVCYDYEGREKFSFGGQGSGPGEFTNSPTSIAIWQNYVVAADIPQFELELFNLDGTYNRTVSYIEQMISPVSNIVADGKKLIIEGLSLNMEGDTALLHKVISINDSFQIKEEAIRVRRKLTSFNDIFTNLNPFEMNQTYFSLGDSIAKIISNDILRIYRVNDSIDILLQSITLVKINKEIVNYFENDPNTEAMKKQGIKINFSFPKYLPKIKSVFKLQNKILALSQNQYINNEINKSKNYIYVYDEKKKNFVNVSIPDNIPVSKIINMCKSNIILNYEGKIKIFKCKIECNY